MTKLVTDNQGREVARLARGMGLPCGDFQSALTDGTVTEFLRGLMSTSKLLAYPDWVMSHLTPEHEIFKLADPGEIELWLDPRQERGSRHPTGQEVYDVVMREHLLNRSLSLGELKWYEANPYNIPADCKGKLIYGWASVVRRVDFRLHVPCLNCRVPRPRVEWVWLGLDWLDIGPAGLRKES